MGSHSVYRLEAWEIRYGVIAGITDRHGDPDLRIPPRSPASHRAAWERLLDSFRPAFRSSVTSRQVHGSEVRIHDRATPGWNLALAADGHLTCQGGILLTVTVADCVPVYLLEPDSGTVGLIHAGWRGIRAGILEAGIERMLHLSGAHPEALVMHCGVSICGKCYQVGPEVHKALGRHPDRGNLDLKAALSERGRTMGVSEITISHWCTSHHHQRFHSHRKSGGKPERMVAFLGLPAP